MVENVKKEIIRDNKNIFLFVQLKNKSKKFSNVLFIKAANLIKLATNILMLI